MSCYEVVPRYFATHAWCSDCWKSRVVEWWFWLNICSELIPLKSSMNFWLNPKKIFDLEIELHSICDRTHDTRKYFKSLLFLSTDMVCEYRPQERRGHGYPTQRMCNVYSMCMSFTALTHQDLMTHIWGVFYNSVIPNSSNGLSPNHNLKQCWCTIK